MGKITEALKKVTDEHVARIQKKPESAYIVRKIDNSTIDEHIVSFHDSSSPIAEQYKIVRTNLQMLKKKNNQKMFIITSSVNSEGKTVTSINLSMTIASDLDNKSILLIDADMRKGKIAQYLGINNHKGLSEILSGKAKLEDCIISPNMDNLSVILAGKAPKNPAELLGSKKMQSLLTSVKAQYDYILIDTPPVMPLTDATILGSKVDGAILVIQAGRTQRNVVKQTLSRLHQAHTDTLGYIMTKVEFHLPKYLYRYVQEYGTYKYEHTKEDSTVSASKAC